MNEKNQPTLKFTEAQKKFLLAMPTIPVDVLTLLRTTKARNPTISISKSQVAKVREQVSAIFNTGSSKNSATVAAILKKLDAVLFSSDEITQIAVPLVCDIEASNIKADTFLSRRIKQLITMANSNKLYLGPMLDAEIKKELELDLRSIVILENGEINLSTCSPLVRTIARSVDAIKDLGVQQVSTDLDAVVQSVKDAPHDSLKTVARNQREYFETIGNSLDALLGTSHAQFDDFNALMAQLQKNERRTRSKFDSALSSIVAAVQKYSADNHTKAYTCCKQLGGAKMVVGGSSNFSSSHLQGVRKLLLYADSIFIPDPLLAWVESSRPNEKSIAIHILRNAFTLLRLKPVVDAELSIPPVLIFPSWEKSLETVDEQTKDGIGRLSLDFFSHYLGATFEDESEVVDWVSKHGESFLEKVESGRLFVAPECQPYQPIEAQIIAYKQYCRKSRSKEFADTLDQTPHSLLVLNAIAERLVPQFHLLENSDCFDAQPLVCLPQQSHYFQLCAAMSSGGLVAKNILRKDTENTMQALSSTKFQWLGDIPIEALVKLRKENANAEFRTKLSGFTSILHSANENNIDKIGAEVFRGILSLMDEHKREVRKLEEEFATKHFKSLVGLLITWAAQLNIYLAPLAFLGLRSIGKYCSDKMDERSSKSKAMNSLAGVLAETYDSSTLPR